MGQDSVLVPVYGWNTQNLYEDFVEERADELADGTAIVYDWPWKSWNRGDRVRPLRAGMVGLITAPDGMGKSTYLEHIAEHWARKGIETVLVHLEDDLAYKLDRRMARNAMVDMAHIEDNCLSAGEKGRVAEATEYIRGWADHLHYLDAAGCNADEILDALQLMVNDGFCQAAVIDYLDKIMPSTGKTRLFGDNVWERQAHDMERIKSWAERNKLVVMAATQGNKSMLSQDIQTRQTIQGSGQKSHKAQLVVILTRPLIDSEGGLKDNNGKVVAEQGEYSPFVTVRVDKQNRGRTCAFRQIIAGKHFVVGDLEYNEYKP